MARVLEKAPDFEAEALVGKAFEKVKLSSYKGKYVVLFFYPLDFTFVCPTEILEFNKYADEFTKRDCVLLGASVDSVYTHLAWTKTSKEEGGLGGPLKFPLLADLDRSLCKAYDVLLKDGHSLRGLFIINKEGVVVHITKNAPPVGRSVKETLRLLKGFQYTDKYGEVCPADWDEGAETIKPDPEAKKEYFKKVNKS